VHTFALGSVTSGTVPTHCELLVVKEAQKKFKEIFGFELLEVQKKASSKKKSM
jgi:hypothetical protein